MLYPLQWAAVNLRKLVFLIRATRTIMSINKPQIQLLCTQTQIRISRTATVLPAFARPSNALNTCITNIIHRSVYEVHNALVFKLLTNTVFNCANFKPGKEAR